MGAHPGCQKEEGENHWMSKRGSQGFNYHVYWNATNIAVNW